MIAEGKEDGSEGTGVCHGPVPPLRPEQQKGELLPMAGMPISRRAAPLGTQFPVPEQPRLPPVWRTRVESGLWGCSLREGCTAAAFFPWGFSFL